MYSSIQCYQQPIKPHIAVSKDIKTVFVHNGILRITFLKKRKTWFVLP